MSEYPKFPPSQQQERKGVSRFASQIADHGLIWRETPNSDVGIDGQLEYVDAEGFSTGVVVAVQVKSGPSYFTGDNETILYQPAPKHVTYWREFPIPVLLAIHDPARQEIFWVDARLQLRGSEQSEVIRVPKNRTVASSSAADFFGTSRPMERLMPESDVVLAMVQNRHNDAGFRMSFFELFGFGIADMGRKLFFAMSLCMEIAEFRAEEADVGVGVGWTEHQFIDRYVSFLVSQGLIYYDYSDYLIDRDQREISPTFLTPLTRRGQRALQLMQESTNDAFHECLLRIDPVSVLSIGTRLESVAAAQERMKP